jgi:hypothetical protein
MNSDAQWLWSQWLNALPPDKVTSVVEWATANVRLIGSARSEAFDPSIGPWECEPLERCNDGTRRCTVIKPTQSGGSVIGEIILLFWLATWSSGDVAYFWQNDQSADGRWSKRFEKIMLACKALMARTSADRFKWMKGLVIFPHANFEMKGVRTDRAVASDAFRGIVNEELHDVEGGWESGKLAQVYGRQTAYWNSKCFNISNAGFVNSDLHKAFLAGTQQHWEVLCPHCGQYHEMRCEWKEEEKHLGGLRYNADGCRLGDYVYDYAKLAPTIFYQMPCGHCIADDITERRALSQSGRYSEPRNKGAQLTERSYIYQAVSCDFVPWIEIIKRKHAALKAMAIGDYKPWFDYLREVECKFVDIGKDRPAPQRGTIVTSERKKNREGMANRVDRFAGLDWQKGKLSEGQTSHWWLLIQDWDANGNSLVVWEGRCDTEGEVAAVLKQHEVKPCCVVVDTSWNATYVYNVCLKYGYNAVKVDEKPGWPWEDGSFRFYSEPRPLFMVASAPPSRNDNVDEPQFWHVSKYTGMERLIFIRQSPKVKYEIPVDVSPEFLQHFDSWSLELIRQKDGQPKMKWRQMRDDDHLFQCGVYIISMIDLLGAFTGLGEFTPPVVKPELEPA